MNLRTARISKNIGQKELAEKIGITSATLSNWELGKSSPNNAERKYINEILGEEVEYEKISVSRYEL